MAQGNFILENVVYDTYLQETGSFDESLEGVQTFTLKQVTKKQRELKQEGTATHIRIYSDAQVHALQS
ncbi:hypothetical protein [Dokdonia sp.]|uniref:hypothetical protein n=1 Tax=Dokdonia sp. TaxID=2024995 RepID=UPI0032674EA4